MREIQKVVKDSVHYYANLLLTYAAENNNLVVEEFAQRKLGNFYLYSDTHRNKKKAQYYFNKSYFRNFTLNFF